MRKPFFLMFVSIIAVGVFGGWLYLLNQPAGAFTTSAKWTSTQYPEDGNTTWGDDLEAYLDSLDAWAAGTGTASWPTVTATTVFNSNGTANLDTLDVDGASDFAGDINYSDTFWDDLLVAPLAVAKLGSPTIDPTLTTFRGGTYTYAFSASAANKVYFGAQMPHRWKEGTAISAHLHWAGSNTHAGAAYWQLEYVWANSDARYATTTTTASVASTVSTTAAYTSKYATFGTINATGKTISSILIATLSRAGAAGTDAYTGTGRLLGVDFHYEIDSPGSSSELVK